MPMGIIPVRLKRESIEALDRIATIRGINRSAVIRELVNNAGTIFRFLDERREKLSDLDGDLTEFFLKEAEDVPPERLEKIARAAIQAAQTLTERALAKRPKAKE
jgi:hypothetical protein